MARSFSPFWHELHKKAQCNHVNVLAPWAGGCESRFSGAMKVVSLRACSGRSPARHGCKKMTDIERPMSAETGVI